MARLSLPTSARLSSSIRVDPTNSAVAKALNRLSRPSLLSLVLDWLDEKNLPLCPPLLRRPARGEDGEEEEGGEDGDDDDSEYEGDFYPPERSLGELRELYASLQVAKGSSKRDVVDRIIEGDWRHGLSLYQLAMADLQHLYEHPTSLKWTAFRVQRLQNLPPVTGDDRGDSAGAKRKHDEKSLVVPRFHPSTFLQNLQAEIPPDVKAHYNFDRPKDLPLLLLRIFVLDSPYNTSLAVANNNNNSSKGNRNTNNRSSSTVTSFDAARTIYIAFPDASPHIYISASQTQATAAAAAATTTTDNSTTTRTAGESRSLRALVVDAIPKALSRPRARYTLVPGGLSTRNLSALLHVKGAGRTNAAGGGWGVYAAAADPSKAAVPAAAVAESPLNPVVLALPTPPLSDADAGGGGGGSGNSSGGAGAKKRRWEPEEVARDPVEARHERAVKRAKAAAQARFGASARAGDGKGIERLDVLIEDPFPDAAPSSRSEDDDDEEEEEAGGGGEEARDLQAARGGRRSDADLRFARHGQGQGQGQAQEPAADEDEDEDEDGDDDDGDRWRPRVKLSFHGSHVFAGIRQLVEAGVVDGARVPGWMTGEEGVSIGIVRHGRVKGHRGAGL